MFDTYVHDLYTGGDSHPDDIEMEGGSDITVGHSTLFAGTGGNSAISTDPTKMSNVSISSNLIAGGGYTLFCPRDFQHQRKGPGQPSQSPVLPGRR